MTKSPRRRLFGPLTYATHALTAIVGLMRALQLLVPVAVEYDSVDQLPAPVLAAVREAVPGYEPESIEKINFDMTDAYRISCRDQRGKYRNVYISPGGKIRWFDRRDRE